MSGFHIGGLHPLRFAERLAELGNLLARIVALRGKGRAGAPRLLESLRGIEVTRGGHSWLERRFLELMATAGLPPPQTQQVVGRRRQSLIRVDAAFAGTPIIVEVLGYAFHRTVAQMSADTERLTRLVLDGKEPLQFTYVQVTDDPEFVVASVREGLARHLPVVHVTARNDCRSMW